MEHFGAGGQDAADADVDAEVAFRAQESVIDALLHHGMQEGRQWRRRTHNPSAPVGPATLAEIAWWLTQRIPAN